MNIDVNRERAIDLALSQEELATLVGATRQSVNASLREFEREGLLTRERRRFVLTRPTDLRRTVTEQPAAPG